jgi:hypothetical protein
MLEKRNNIRNSQKYLNIQIRFTRIVRNETKHKQSSKKKKKKKRIETKIIINSNNLNRETKQNKTKNSKLLI